MNDVQLTFYNKSNETNNPEIALVQKGQNIAWTLIQNCGVGSSHPFVYAGGSTVAAEDAWGNYSQQLKANPGEAFEMVKDATGDVILRSSTPATNPATIQIENNLPQGSINAQVYKTGRLLAQQTGVAPEQMAVFEFKPILMIGAVSGIEQGQVMDSAVISQINTEFNLTGIASADIIMTGGGPGPSATPFMFSLTNIQYA